MPSVPATPRTCSPCTLCCRAPAIVPLHKPAGDACRYLSTHPETPGCSVYAQRGDPKFADCRSFECLWIQGHFTESDRPDRLGVIFSAKPDPDAPPDAPRDRIFVTEQSPGAAQHPRVQQLIREQLAKNLTVAITNKNCVIALQPAGHAWYYRIDPADPLHARLDPTSKPVALTIKGHLQPQTR